MRTNKRNHTDIIRQIDAYGVSVGRWSRPMSQAELLAQAERDEAVAAALEQAGKLDEVLDQYLVHPRADVQALLRRLPDQAPSRTRNGWIEGFKWFLPDDLRLVWRPVLAGVVPVVFGFFLGQVVPLDESDGLWDDGAALDWVILGQTTSSLTWEDLLLEQGGEG